MISAHRLCTVVGGGETGTAAMTHRPHSLRVPVVRLARHTALALSGTRETGALAGHREQPSPVPERGAPRKTDRLTTLRPSSIYLHTADWVTGFLSDCSGYLPTLRLRPRPEKLGLLHTALPWARWRLCPACWSERHWPPSSAPAIAGPETALTSPPTAWQAGPELVYQGSRGHKPKGSRTKISLKITLSCQS